MISMSGSSRKTTYGEQDEKTDNDIDILVPHGACLEVDNRCVNSVSETWALASIERRSHSVLHAN